MKTLSIKLPDSVDIDSQEALLIIVTKLYEQGKLSLGEAAEISGLSKRAFIEMLDRYGVSLFNLNAGELSSDFQNA